MKAVHRLPEAEELVGASEARRSRPPGWGPHNRATACAVPVSSCFRAAASRHFSIVIRLACTATPGRVFFSLSGHVPRRNGCLDAALFWLCSCLIWRRADGTIAFSSDIARLRSAHPSYPRMIPGCSSVPVLGSFIPRLGAAPHRAPLWPRAPTWSPPSGAFDVHWVGCVWGWIASLTA